MSNPYGPRAGRTSKVGILALAIVLLTSAGVHATHGGNGQSISDASPSPTCNPLAVPAGRQDMEIQPHLAVNPTDPNNIAVAWTQDWFDGIVVGVSHDGGVTWTKSIPPNNSHCSGGDYGTADHAHLSFGPEGLLYLSTWNDDPTITRVLRTRVTVHVSTNGGDTWSDPVTLEETTSTHDRHFLEWSWVVVDPTRPGTAYATWMSRDYVDLDPIGILAEFEMRFARTEDGGKTWSAPRDISPAVPGHDRYLPELVVLPDGSLVNLYFQFPECPIEEVCPPDNLPVMAARSTDRGDTWSAPIEIVLRENVFRYLEEPRVRQLGHGPAAHPPLSLPAVSGNGTMYYTWVDYSPDFASKLYLTSSSDGGATWAAPRVIRESDVPMGNPNVAVAPNGRVGVLFYDFRNDDPGTDAAETDVWFISAPGGAQGRAAWKERHVAGPFDVFSVPDHAGINQGIVGTPGGFLSAYTLGNCAASRCAGDAQPPSTIGPSDIFFSRIPIP